MEHGVPRVTEEAANRKITLRYIKQHKILQNNQTRLKPINWEKHSKLRRLIDEQGYICQACTMSSYKEYYRKLLYLITYIFRLPVFLNLLKYSLVMIVYFPKDL